MDSELISESVKLLGEGVEPDSTEVFVKYDLLGGWEIELRGDATDPIDGFGSLKMVYSEINEWHATEEGVTGRLLRLIPFRDAQQRFDRLRNQALAADMPSPPDTYASPTDFARLAEVYLWFASKFKTQPMKQMADQFDLNRNTLSARVSRAKQMGMLSKTDAGGPWKITDKANELLARTGRETNG